MLLEPVTGSPPEDVPSALEGIDDPALPRPLVDPARVVSGGPPPDGIPTIDEPRFQRAADVDWLTPDEPDPRLPPKERVAALGGDTDPVAVPLAALIETGVVELTVAGRPVIVWSVAGLRSALDTEQIAKGRSVGATGAFDPRLDERRLHFTRTGAGRFTDTETGSSWNVLGEATGGPLAGAQLDPVEHLDTFWFAWAAFHPDTRIADIPD